MTQIIDLGPDEKITAPGFYRMPLSQHHAQPCDGVSVTSSVLRTMELQTPADVWAFSLLNPNRYVRPDTDATRLGTAMALFVEGGRDRVLEGFKVHAEDKPRKPAAAQTAAYLAGKVTEANKASVEYWAQVDADPDLYLDPKELDDICEAGAVLAADPAACLVMDGLPEITMAWQDERTGLWILSRPDTLSFDGAVSDYKRMATKGGPFDWRLVDRRITDYGIDMQMALAAEGMERLTGEWPGVVGIVAQLAGPPYHVILREILEEDLRIAQWRNRQAIDRFAECLRSGDWPGPGMDTAAYQRPAWQREMLLERMNTTGAAP